MKKVSLKIPKGTKCKNGICEQDIELDTEIEIPEVKPFLQVQPTPELNFESENQPNAAQSTSRGTTAAEKIEKPNVEYVPPNYLPKYKCKNGNCGTAHENPNYTQTAKGVCPNCKQFSPLIKGKCYWCNDDVEELDQEELEDLGIPLPQNQGHEHEGEHDGI